MYAIIGLAEYQNRPAVKVELCTPLVVRLPTFLEKKRKESYDYTLSR